jgi:capsular polysaccharide biosynthesis protein
MPDVQLNNGRNHAQRTGIEAALGAAVRALQDENVVTVRDPLRLLWRRWWVILLAMVVAVALAVGYSLLQEPTYIASSKLLVVQEEADPPANASNANTLIIPGSVAGDVAGLRDMTATVMHAVDTRPVAEAVVRQLGLGIGPDDLLQRLSVNRLEDTQFIEVRYEGSDPEEAQRIVNGIGDVFSEQIFEVASNARVSTRVWEEATPPSAPTSPEPVRNGALALVLGGLLGIGLAFLLERLDDSWRSPEEVEQIMGAPTLGAIPQLDLRGVASVSNKKRKGER